MNNQDHAKALADAIREIAEATGRTIGVEESAVRHAAREFFERGQVAS